MSKDVTEILEELKKDESWGESQQERNATVNIITMQLVTR